MTTQATRRVEFDAAHRLPQHDGKCRRLHGHRYVVDVTVEGRIQIDGPKRGMIVDFSDLDAEIQAIVGEWDHRTILYRDDPLVDEFQGCMALVESLVVVPFVPTAENIAGWIAGLLTPVTTDEIAAATWKVVEVTVWETPKGRATWRP